MSPDRCRTGSDNYPVDVGHLRYSDLVSASSAPRHAERAHRAGTGQAVVAELEHPRSQRFVGTLMNRRRAPWVHSSRRTFLRAGFAAVSASAAAAATSLGPASAATQAGPPEGATGPYPYRIVNGCDAAFADHNCRPGCGAQPVCQDSECCDRDGWFRNEPLSGYKPLPTATCGVAGDTFQTGDGWLWEYRPAPDAAASDDPCRHCSRLVFRCHDGMALDVATGVWYPQICRTEVECDPSGLPMTSTPDVAQFADVTHGRIDGVSDDTEGRLSVWGWTHIEWFDGPVNWRVEVDGTPRAEGVAGLPRPDVEAQFDTASCCHGFATQIAGLTSGDHAVVLLAGYADIWTRVAEITVAVSATGDAATTTPTGPQVLLPASTDSANDGHGPIGGLDILRASALGGAFASGWAADIQAGDAVLVTASVGGRVVAVTSPTLPRSAPLSRFVAVSSLTNPELGTPGWTLNIPFAESGPQQVCIAVLDPVDGSTTTLGCRQINSSAGASVAAQASAVDLSTLPVVETAALDPGAAPIDGGIESVASLPRQRVEVRGWCAFRSPQAGQGTLQSSSSAAEARPGDELLGVEVIVPGLSSATAAANANRPDLATWNDLARGFAVELTLPVGRHQIQVFGLDADGRRGGMIGLANHLVVPD